jgi:hypothetical protein
MVENRDLVVQVLEASARLLEIELHLAELLLHGQSGPDRVSAVEELEELAFDRLELAGSRAQVDVLLGNVLAVLPASLHTAERGERLHCLGVVPRWDPQDERPAHKALRTSLRR